MTHLGLSSCAKKETKRVVFFIFNFIFLCLLFFYAKKHFLIINIFLIFSFLILKKGNGFKFVTSFLVLAMFIFWSFFKIDYISSGLIYFLPYLAILKKPAAFLGVSFFGFKFISFVLDLKRGKIKNDFLFLDFYNYLVFFPCLISGPLDRFDRFVSDFNKVSSYNYQQIFDAVWRIILGAFKKVILADSLFDLSINSMNISDLSLLPFWKVQVSMYFYMAVLYWDFSGYSDVAIGISKLFGINTPENFNSPYLSRNLSEFWNRWHITLMNWLRDYIYFPIQMTLLRIKMKNTLMILILANFVTFFISGVWHGDGINYLLYGLCHALSFNVFVLYKTFLTKKLSKDQLEKYNNSFAIKVFSIFLTFNYFSFSLYFFTDYGSLLWSQIVF